MTGLRRRHLLGLIAAGGLAGAGVGAHAFAQGDRRPLSVEQWMDEWMSMPKAPGQALHVGRFVEPIYFLLEPIGWTPNPGQTGSPVEVPRGFVTDFASIPRIFWSALRPDGTYTYPAIIHDYLYWTQTQPREEADRIFRLGMEDFFVSPATARLIYDAVRLGGGSSWDANAQLKKRGEQRVLKRFPADPLARWEQWKRQPDVFVR